MPNSKNKKIIYILEFGLFLTLILFQFAWAQDCSQFNGLEAACETTPGCTYDRDTNTCVSYTVGPGELPKEEGAPWCPAAPWDIFGILWCVFQFIFSLPVKIIFLLPAAIGIVVAILGAILLMVAQPLATWMIDNSINLATKASIPSAVLAISDEVRKLSLGLLFLFLAFIGLATILRIAEYQARKALVPLLIIALLINFSSSITGAVVDIGNSFTKSFVSLAKTEGELKFVDVNDILGVFTESLEGMWDVFWENGEFFTYLFKQGFGQNWTGQIYSKGPFIVDIGAIALVGFAAALFFILAGLVIILFGLIFFIRTIFIWILIIVAPIAFVTAVFRTKEIKSMFPGPLNWDTWWTWLLEWSFMGMALAFWLFLAVQLKGVSALIPNIELGEAISSPSAVSLTSEVSPPINFDGSALSDENKESGKMTTAQLTADSVKEEPGQGIGGEADIGASTRTISQKTLKLFNTLFKYLAPTIVLWIGVTTAPGMMGQMAGQAFGTAQSLLGGVISGAVIAGSAFVGAAAGAKGGGIGTRLATGAREGFVKGTTAFARETGLTKLAPEEVRMGISGWARKAGVYGREERARALAEEEEKGKKYAENRYKREGVRGLEGVIESRWESDEYKTAAIDKLIEEKKLRDEVATSPKVKRLILSDYEKAARLSDKKKMGMIERTLVSTLGEDFGKIAEKEGIYTAADKAKDKGKGIDTYTKKIIASVKTADDVKQLQKDWWENPEAMETAQKFWTGAQFGAAGREFGREFIESLTPLITQLKNFKQANDVSGYLHFVWDRPGLARYSETAAAQELGFGSFYELAPEAIKSNPKYRNIRNILAEKP